MRQVGNYFSTRRKKRYGRDQMSYEVNWPALLVRGMRERADRTFRVRHNYAFLTSVPRWREIFATEFEGRRADHEVCDILMPLADRVLSDRTYNNRVGKGQLAAVNQVIEDMTVVSEGYTQEAWVIKLDLKGYFPSALWDIAEQQLHQLIDDASDADLQGLSRDYLRWLVTVLIHANPAAHCELRTPRRYWHEHIPAEKSLLAKQEGEGAAIGRLIWQTAMGLYINDDVRWLNEQCGVRAVCFVDDIVISVPDRRKDYALRLIPELRRRLARKNVRLNERKFYCQRVCHGLEFLGSHIVPYRLHLNNTTYQRALSRSRELNGKKNKKIFVGMMQACFNSYSGLLKNRTDHRRLQQLRDAIDDEWWQYFSWDAQRRRLACLPDYTHHARLARKYHLRLKAPNPKLLTPNSN